VYTYDNENRLTHTYKVLHDGKKNLKAYYDYAPRKKTKHKLHNSKSWLGINGTIKLSYSDILTKEETIGIANQITEEIEYLNGTLNGFRKYYYQ